MTEKVYCPGSDTADCEIRLHYATRRLAKCSHCGRVLSPRPDGRLNKHQAKGRTTASMDKTMESLWAGAEPVSETGLPYVPVDYEGDQTACKSCGNPAPKREFGNAPDECSPCFIGRTANQLVTRRETEALIAELQDSIAD